MDIETITRECQLNLVGLETEIQLVLAAIENQIAVVIEGESGTGKTELAKTIANALRRPFYRVDGDENLTITHLRGWFDPPLVMQSGFGKKSFVPGPLVKAMQEGGLFFFNEVNRAPSEAINGVLAAMDRTERQIEIPQLSRVKAHQKFYSIFTLNPAAYVGTNPLPEAFFDRCILIRLNHKTGEEAKQIVRLRTQCTDDSLINKAVEFTEQTRTSGIFESGASIRATIQLTQLLDHHPLTQRKTFATINAVFSKKVKPHSDEARSVEDCLEVLALPVFFPEVKKKGKKNG
ncbi:MAG: AAA family ATPase [Candidatus Heimdallarchaeota archaeon]